MDVKDLSREQLVELKENYMAELVNEGRFAEVMNCDYNEPSYGDCFAADEIISDEFIFEHYAGIDFVNDDFFCTAGQVESTQTMETDDSLKKLKDLWKSFEDIPINEDECIDKDFHIWEKGTDRYHIWHWFDDRCPNGVAKDLMGL